MGSNNKNKNKKRNKKKLSQNADHLNPTNEPAGNESEQLEETTDNTPSDENTPNEHKKRHYDVDSDNEEDTPRKKKKKKQPMTSDTLEKKGKKSIRQMKKEKFAQRQAEAQALVKDNLKNQCLQYLSQWKHDKQNWKFMKAKQVWLFKNKFSTTLLPDSSWPLLLEYFESAQGNIRKMLLNDASKIIKQMDEWTESENVDQPENDDNQSNNRKPEDYIYKRARDLIQCLEE